ncbi:MAG TPA: SPFH domain-containing protein [Gemmatimonadaceae bacterium]|nr:SPFH domain-containing protein [Gemmatimonadaceae bacterium]
MLRERVYRATNGYVMTLVNFVVLSVAIWQIVARAETGNAFLIVFWSIVTALASLSFAGLFTVQPNEAKALTLFGAYKGSVRAAGFWWANPFMYKRRVSLRARNFETAKLKVNDSHSNPVDIGAIVVWRVVDSAEALFEVDDYENFVRVQSESAVRALASSFPYDAHTPNEVALSTNPDEIATSLHKALQERLQKAGVEIIEARISHLAYAQEIASAMLRRQQANAIIAARQRIVEGAVYMVENALTMLAERAVVSLDNERKAAMVSNLLVVLCSDRDAQPIVNTGTIYQ